MRDLFDKAMTLGASGTSNLDFPLALNAVLGTRFKIMRGYTGSSSIMLAMERGEIQGMCGMVYAGMQTSHPTWITEKKVRQAIQAAIKPEEFIEIVRSGWGITMTGPIPTYRKPWALPATARPAHDVAKAKRLLAEAGLANGFETELIVGTPGDNVKSAQVVKDQLAKVGIQVNLKPTR